MNTNVNIIANRLDLPYQGVEAVIDLLAQGATIPFISRYRKEATGSLNEVQIFEIRKLNEQLEELAARKKYILSTIEAQGKLTENLRSRIEETYDGQVLEDLYLPFKPKRRTRAQIARERGLEPLAELIMQQRKALNHHDLRPYLTDEVKTMEDAIAGASDIIAEWVSESQRTRSYVREVYHRFAVMKVVPAKGKEAEAVNFKNYFNFSSKLSRMSSHQVLAVMRGVDEGLLKIELAVDEDVTLNYIGRFFVHKEGNKHCAEIVRSAVADSFKRLIAPSIENEVLAEAKEKADEAAIANFATNLRQLLLSPPLGSKRILAIDPGFRTGCKVVCLDANGNLLCHDVIYPTPPKNELKKAARRVSDLVEQYDIDAISLGNGTASRETERFLKSVFLPPHVKVFVVNEDGASVYSASKIAREEFPDEDVTVRGAVSIGRRLMDPLAELVKIDPKSIGVGQYQHDVDQKKLKQSLDATVEACVNSVGVDLNTASARLLSYVAGIGEAMATNIVAYRAANGDFRHREDIMRVPRFGAKAFQQAAGFLRIPGSDNILDNTAVHPESYHIVHRMASEAGMPVEEFVKHPELVAALDLNRYVTDTVGLPTLEDIKAELAKPGRDPRSEATPVEFDDDINDISDLREGMVLNGIVNNITDFGAFVDLGVHESGLVHLSEICEKFIKHPSEALVLQQHIRVKVLSVDVDRRRISLTMKGLGD